MRCALVRKLAYGVFFLDALVVKLIEKEEAWLCDG